MRSPGGLAEYGHVVRIAPKGRNILPDPAEGEEHVPQGNIRGRTGDFQKTVHIHPVIDRHQRHAVLREGCAVKARIIVVAVHAAAAGYPHHHRAFCRAGFGRPYIQTQAVAASLYPAREIPRELKRNSTRRERIHNAAPCVRIFRSGEPPPPLIGVLPAGHAPENMHAATCQTSYSAAGSFHYRPFFREGLKGERQQSRGGNGGYCPDERTTGNFHVTTP